MIGSIVPCPDVHLKHLELLVHVSGHPERAFSPRALHLRLTGYDAFIAFDKRFDVIPSSSCRC